MPPGRTLCPILQSDTLREQLSPNTVGIGEAALAAGLLSLGDLRLDLGIGHCRVDMIYHIPGVDPQQGLLEFLPLTAPLA